MDRMRLSGETSLNLVRHLYYCSTSEQALDQGITLCRAIEPFQTGETATFMRHIEKGLQELSQSNGNALLVFSGSVQSNNPPRKSSKLMSTVQARHKATHHTAQ